MGETWPQGIVWGDEKAQGTAFGKDKTQGKLRGIIIFGKMGAGKSTLAHYLEQELRNLEDTYNGSPLLKGKGRGHHLTIRQGSLSGPIKRTFNEMGSIEGAFSNLEHIERPEKPSEYFPREPSEYFPLWRIRKAYQALSETGKGIFGQDIWNFKLYYEFYHTRPGKFLDDYLPSNMLCIIDDGRTLPEYEFWASKGFIPIGVNASPEVRRERLIERDGFTPGEAEMEHITEKEVDTVMPRTALRIYNNDYDTYDLRLFAETMMDKLMAFKGGKTD